MTIIGCSSHSASESHCTLRQWAPQHLSGWSGPTRRLPRGVVSAGERGVVTLFLAGDVMTGRGIDQVLSHPGDPRLHEPWVKSAETCVELAERANGPIARPVPPDYFWGDALVDLERVRPDARVVNLETAVTAGFPWPGKGIHYRMHPANVACLTAAGLDACVLANNHVLDGDGRG